MHTPPVPSSVLTDPDLDPDEAVGAVVRAYHMHVETYLATTFPPVNVEQWVASGLLGSPQEQRQHVPLIGVMHGASWDSGLVMSRFQSLPRECGRDMGT